METVTTTRITYREALRQLELKVPKRRVRELLGVSKTTFWRWERDGTLAELAAQESASAGSTLPHKGPLPQSGTQEGS